MKLKSGMMVFVDFRNQPSCYLERLKGFSEFRLEAAAARLAAHDGPNLMMIFTL